MCQVQSVRPVLRLMTISILVDWYNRQAARSAPFVIVASFIVAAAGVGVWTASKTTNHARVLSRCEAHRTKARGRDRISPRTEGHQMRENMSLLSFWGLVFALIAVTLFVIITRIKKRKVPSKYCRGFAPTLSGHLFGSKDR